MTTPLGEFARELGAMLEPAPAPDLPVNGYTSASYAEAYGHRPAASLAAMPAETMRVAVSLAVDVDVAAWRAEYGDPPLTRADIREAIREAVASAAGIVAPDGLIVAVELR